LANVELVVQILRQQPRNAPHVALDSLEAPVSTHRVRHHLMARLTLFASFRRVSEQILVQEVYERIRFIAALIRYECLDIVDEG